MHIERRRAPRIEVLGRLQGQMVSADTLLTVREISLGGLSFESSTPFALGVVHEFRLTLGDESAVLLRGRIVRSDGRINNDGSILYITGVQFIDDEPGAPGSPLGGLIDKIR